MDRDTLEQTLIGIEPLARKREKVFYCCAAVEVPVDRLLGLMQKLRQDERFAFDMLLDHTAIDRPAEQKKLTTNEHELTQKQLATDFTDYTESKKQQKTLNTNYSVIELVYNLYSTKHGHSLMVFCTVSRENPVAPTMERIWQTAHWQEREVFDLFGVLYDEHSDLRRLFLEDDWKGYPLRKDYKDDDMLEFGE